MKGPVFLDRDGTLNTEVDFVKSPAELVLLPGAVAGIARLHAAGHELVVITNQSGIARGFYTETTLAHIHAKLQRELGGRVRAFLHCPHLPEAGGPYGGDCQCRKPQQGLLRQASELLGIELAGGCVIGDSARDLLMARGLPLRTVLLRCGKPWREQLQLLRAAGVEPDMIVDDVRAAAEWILTSE